MSDQEQAVVADNPVVETPVEAPAAEPKPQNQLPEGVMRRFGELTAARRAAEEEAARHRAEVDRLNAMIAQQQQPSEQQQQQNPMSHANIEQLVNEMAERRVSERLAVQQTQQKVAAIEAAGREKYGDEFDRSVTNLQMTGIGGQHFLDALTSVKGGEAAVRYLGDPSNIDEAMRIANLPPMQMALAISELAPKAAKQYAKPISSAPAPMQTLEGARGTVDGEPNPSDTAAWMKWRNENRKSRR